MVGGLLLVLAALPACLCVLLCICACRRWRHVHSKGYRTVGGAWTPGSADAPSDAGSACSCDDDDAYDYDGEDGCTKRTVSTPQQDASILSDEEYGRIYGRARAEADTLADMMVEAETTPHEWTDIEGAGAEAAVAPASGRAPADEFVLSF